MNTDSLKPLIEEFMEAQQADKEVIEHQAQHEERIARAAELLTPDGISRVNSEELEAFLEDKDARLGIRFGVKRLMARLVGEEGERLPEVREALADLVARGESGLQAEDFNECLLRLKGIGSAFLSEILALRFPDKYWLLNKQVLGFFDECSVDIGAELPRGKKGNHGEKYFGAGRHLDDLRRAITEEMGQEVDFMLTDLFVYWYNQQEPASRESWQDEVLSYGRERLSPRSRSRREEGERLARQLLIDKLGDFDEGDLRQFLQHLNTCGSGDEPNYGRFGLAFKAANAGKLLSNVAKFNEWAQRLWQAGDDEIYSTLGEFWKAGDLPGAGVALPTAILYLRNPDEFNICVPVTARGLEAITGERIGRLKTENAYRRYNALVNDLRRKYDLVPQGVDIVLTVAGKPEGPSPDDPEGPYTLDLLCQNTYLDASFWSQIEALMEEKKQLVFYGPPGTGKTWVAEKFAYYWAEATEEHEGSVDLVQFHPSYSYEDFMEGIRPDSVPGPDGRHELSYPVKPGVFRRFCEEAGENPSGRYVLVIDEINRGDCRAFLGN